MYNCLFPILEIYIYDDLNKIFWCLPSSLPN